MSSEGNVIDVAYEARVLWNVLSEWSQLNFGSDDLRGPLGAIRHLQLEAKECEDAISGDADDKTVSRELADCLILVLDASRRHGLSLVGLLSEARDKMRINVSRRWPKPTGDNRPIEHIRDASDR